jgi:soluble lytic murein transglycosylase
MSRTTIKKYAGRMAAVALVLALGAPAQADVAQAMRTALDLAAGQDWAGALAVAPAGVGHDVIEWQRLRAGEGLLGDYEDFLARRADWPGLPLLHEKGEAAVARSTTPGRVIAYFSGSAPETGAGAVALVQAWLAVGDRNRAEDAAMQAWAALSLSADEEAALLALAPQALALMHEVRLDRLLWEGRRAEALRMIPRVGADWQALAKARLGLRFDEPGPTALIAAVPKARADDPGLAFERFLWRMKRDKYDDAAALIQERSTSATALGDPAAWAERRAILTRWLIRQGRAKEAYRVAARHYLGSGGADYADLEFLAGFVALRKLNDPSTALKHFKHLEAGVETPISQSRALYWQGRAHEAAGDMAAAKAAYQKAAAFQTAYYGLLAAEKLGLTLDSHLLSDARPADWRGAGWTKSSVHQAAVLLLAAGDMQSAKRFWLHLGESLDGTGLNQMADMALAMRQPHVAVLVGKAAAERSVILPRAYFPLVDMVPDGLAVSRAFALAISRRESEFNPEARSHADARGLMQLMPGTAKMMAKELGLAYDGTKLTSDPAYNAALGAEYLSKLVAEFGPSIALVASGYNAGPGRPRKWMQEFGDPRAASVDVVDWVEAIPFTETRTYVMRVVEGVVIYRAKLRGAAGRVNVTGELKG